MKAMATNDDAKHDGSGSSFFARYIDEPKRPVEPEKILRGPLLKPIAPPTDRRSPPVEQLLDWLINHWSEPTISLRNICRSGPNSIRERKSAIALTKSLTENGWLAPVKSRRRDMKEWRIARGPGG
jgi:hypothetical protein